MKITPETAKGISSAHSTTPEAKEETFYCADWDRVGSICEEQCPRCLKSEQMPDPKEEVSDPDEGKFKDLLRLLAYRNKYQINIQFWPDQTAVYIMKDDVDLVDFGGGFDFAIKSSLNYLDRINKKLTP